MAELLGLIVTVAHAVRAPAATHYKILGVMSQNGSVGIHICNTTAVTAKFRIAIVESGYSYVDDSPPATYQFSYYDVDIEANGFFDTCIYELDAGAQIVVYTNTDGVTFLPNGIRV